MAERLLDEALDAGAFGISSGLIYPPGLFASAEELAGLCRRLPPGRVYATHMRDEGAGLLSSVEEAIAIGEAAGCRVQISHLKAVGRANWGLIDGALDRLDAPRARGLVVGQDAYPYEATSTMLSVMLPPWCEDGGPEATLECLGDKVCLARAREEIVRGGSMRGGSTGTRSWSRAPRATNPRGCHCPRSPVRSAGSPSTRSCTCSSASDCASRWSALRWTRPTIETVLAHPETMIGSDGLPPGVGGRPHPRLFGTFPRILGRYVRRRQVLGLPEALARMTSLPAAALGLRDRGVLEPGRVADVVVFSAEAVDEGGGYRDPVHPPVGIDAVIQDGHLAVSGGRWCGVRRGRRLSPV